jgi:hypothetical protein
MGRIGFQQGLPTITALPNETGTIRSTAIPAASSNSLNPHAVRSGAPGIGSVSTRAIE